MRGCTVPVSPYPAASLRDTAKSRFLHGEYFGVGFYSFFRKDVKKKKEPKQKLIKRSSLIPCWYLKYCQASKSIPEKKKKKSEYTLFSKKIINQYSIKPVPCYSCQHGPLLWTSTREGFQLQQPHGLQRRGCWQRERGSSRREGGKEGEH